MNASARREGSGVCPGRPASPVRSLAGSCRRRGLRRAFLTGIAFATPVLGAAAPPTAPAPPTLPVAEKPANTGLFSKSYKTSPTAAQPATQSATQSAGTAATPPAGSKATAAQPTASGQSKASDAPTGVMKPASVWNPLGSWSPSQSLATLFPPRAPSGQQSTTASRAAAGTVGVDASAKPADAQPWGRQVATPSAATTAASSAASSAAAKAVVITAPPAATAGRFDPDLGPAGYVVSDAAAPTPAAAPAPQDDGDFLASTPVSPAGSLAEPAAIAANGGSVSLVSWLSKSYADYVSSAGEGDPAADCPAVCVTDRCCPTWQIQTDAMFFWQGNIPSRSLYIDSATEATVLDANQLQNRAAIAPRYAIIYNRDDCRAIEVNYFQAWGFGATQQLGALDAPILNDAGDGAFTIDNMLGLSYDTIGYVRATSSAHIQSFEVNLRRRNDGGMIQWISGFRWLEWGQGLTLEDAIYQGGDPTPIGYDILSVATLNNLYGWQWGGDMTLWNAGRWIRINGVGKAGIYYNHQAMQNTYYDNGIDEPTTVAEAKDVASFVGETGINASVAINRWLSWRLGYSFFWLGGVAVPARQLSLTDIPNGTSSVNANGSVFLQAATTGLEARW
jgi:hypothetical protein